MLLNSCKSAANELNLLARWTNSEGPNSHLNKAAIESIMMSLTLPCDSNTGAFRLRQNCKSSYNEEDMPIQNHKGVSKMELGRRVGIWGVTNGPLVPRHASRTSTSS